MPLTWEQPPEDHDPTVMSKNEIAAELAVRPGEWAVVARHDRAARAEAHAARIREGKEYGAGFEARYVQVSSEHRVYARL